MNQLDHIDELIRDIDASYDLINKMSIEMQKSIKNTFSNSLESFLSIDGSPKFLYYCSYTPAFNDGDPCERYSSFNTSFSEDCGWNDALSMLPDNVLNDDDDACMSSSAQLLWNSVSQAGAWLDDIFEDDIVIVWWFEDGEVKTKETFYECGY